MALPLSACKGPDGRLAVGLPGDLAVPKETLASPEARAHGRALFLEHCALCHGVRADGQGVRREGFSRPPRDFTDPNWREPTSPRRMFFAIREGSPGTAMSAWKALDEGLTWDLTAYVLAVSRRRQVILEGRRIEIRGIVQGVGFAPGSTAWPARRASRAASGNDAAGVTIEAFGPARRSTSSCRRLRRGRLRPRDIPNCQWDADPARSRGTSSWIAHSRDDGDRRVSIPPELATCPDCVAEIFQSANRRYRYAFTNCTNCGPRFTIARDVPYDRPATTMAAFRMCRRRQREYEDPTDRRFHAQPNACPACGPEAHGPSPRRASRSTGASPIALAAAALPKGASWPSRASAASTWPATPRWPSQSLACETASSARTSRSP